MVTILLGPSPLPFTSGLPKKVSMRMAAWFFGVAIRLQKEPGHRLTCYRKLPCKKSSPGQEHQHRLPERLPVLPRSSAQGAQALSPEVRNAVSNAVEKWNGSDPGMDGGWFEEVSAHLGKRIKTPDVWLSLTALAPYRVDESIVRAFSASSPGDKRLISALAWSSFTAARKIGSWL